MKWFTREWQLGLLSEGQTRETIAEYMHHVSRIRGRIVGRADELTELGLHDAVVMNHRVENDSFAWELLVLEPGVGYGVVRLSYADAHLNVPPDDVDGQCLTDDDMEVLYDEVDIQGEACVHRLLMGPSGELHITFSSVSVTRQPLSGRRR